MYKFGFHSVFARLFVSVFLALIAFAIAIILLAQLVHNNSHTVRSRAVARQIATQVDPFLSEVSFSLKNNNRLQARYTLAVIKKSFDIFDESLNAQIGLYDPNKQLILQTSDSKLPATLIHESSWLSDMLPSLSGEPPRHVQIKTSSGYTIWYESRIPPSRNRLLGMFNLFSGTLLLLGIMSLVLWRIAHNMTWRINEMSKQMKLLGDGDFSVRVSEQGNDEIAVLAHGFNQSAHKIEKLINANSLLLAHASHEFRTPITRIRLQTEMLNMLAETLTASDQEKINKRLSAINRDLTGLNDLVESILLVSRLDAGHALEKQETVDLYELVAQECQHYSESSLYGESIVLQSQPKLLTHLIRNLLNNALIHGTPPIHVCVYGSQSSDEAMTIPSAIALMMNGIDKDIDGNQLEVVAVQTPDSAGTHEEKTPENKASNNKDKETKIKTAFFRRFGRKEDKPVMPNFAVLAVIDQGAGIATDKRQDIFSPFVRLKQEKKGSGLGLSLVAQIVETHGGHILTDTWQGKTRFLVILPIKKPAIKDNKSATINTYRPT